jgi:hypothetical protein
VGPHSITRQGGGTSSHVERFAHRGLLPRLPRYVNLIDLVVGADFEQENIVFLLTGAFDEIEDDAQIVAGTARPLLR